MSIETIFDPWASAARLGINIIRTPLVGARGYTNGYDTIWVHDNLSLSEERCTVTHELVHCTQGHCGEQPADVETLVCKVTARWLIPWRMLMGAWGDRFDIAGVAAELCVTPQVVLDRISYATPQELAMLWEASCDSRAA